MYRKLIAGVIVVLVAAFPCLGAVVGNQGFGIGNSNGAGILGGGLSTSSNLLVVNELQQGSDQSGMIRTVQAEMGALGQGAAAAAIDGFFGVTQQGNVNGFQQQYHSGSGASLGNQFQGLGVDLGQQVEAAQGSHGMAVGLQAMVGVQVQLIATPWGVNLNLQPVMASVYDSVGL